MLPAFNQLLNNIGQDPVHCFGWYYEDKKHFFIGDSMLVSIPGHGHPDSGFLPVPQDLTKYSSADTYMSDEPLRDHPKGATTGLNTAVAVTTPEAMNSAVIHLITANHDFLSNIKDVERQRFLNGGIEITDGESVTAGTSQEGAVAHVNKNLRYLPTEGLKGISYRASGHWVAIYDDITVIASDLVFKAKQKQEREMQTTPTGIAPAPADIKAAAAVVTKATSKLPAAAQAAVQAAVAAPAVAPAAPVVKQVIDDTGIPTQVAVPKDTVGGHIATTTPEQKVVENTAPKRKTPAEKALEEKADFDTVVAKYGTKPKDLIQHLKDTLVDANKLLTYYDRVTKNTADPSEIADLKKQLAAAEKKAKAFDELSATMLKLKSS